MGILSDFVTNLQYYYIQYKKEPRNLLTQLFHIHKCNCDDCEGCDYEDGCVQVDSDMSDDLNNRINEIRYLICDDCYTEEEDDDYIQNDNCFEDYDDYDDSEEYNEDCSD